MKYLSCIVVVNNQCTLEMQSYFTSLEVNLTVYVGNISDCDELQQVTGLISE